MSYLDRSTSVATLKALMDDLLPEITAVLPVATKRPVLPEFYQVPFFDLEDDKRIQLCRVSLYEMPEVVTTQTGAARPDMSDQAYAIDISVVRGYMGDASDRGEFPLMLIRDAIIEWAKVVDAGLLSNGYIYTFAYVGSDLFERNERLTNRTLNFTAKRDLYKTQLNP